MIFVGVSSLFPPPIWNSENEQGWQVSHCASDAAIFIGWYLSSVTPSSLPTIMLSNDRRDEHDQGEPGRRGRTTSGVRAAAQLPGRDRRA